MSNVRTRPPVHMWTDGGQAGGNPGKGAGVAVFVSDTKVRVVGEPLGYCTNNFAEASAVAVGLEVLRYPCDIFLYTDSKYVMNGVARLKRGSMLTTNQAAWDRVWVASHQKHRFTQVTHTYGHSDDNVNNLADAWASWCSANQARVDRSYDTLADALSDAPKTGHKKKKNSKNRAWSGNRRSWSSY